MSTATAFPQVLPEVSVTVRTAAYGVRPTWAVDQLPDEAAIPEGPLRTWVKSTVALRDRRRRADTRLRELLSERQGAFRADREAFDRLLDEGGKAPQSQLVKIDTELEEIAAQVHSLGRALMRAMEELPAIAAEHGQAAADALDGQVEEVTLATAQARAVLQASEGEVERLARLQRWCATGNWHARYVADDSAPVGRLRGDN